MFLCRANLSLKRDGGVARCVAARIEFYLTDLRRPHGGTLGAVGLSGFQAVRMQVVALVADSPRA